MANLLDLANKIDKKRGKVKAIAKDYSVQFAINCFYKLQELSPVDTSQLISNWTITLNKKSRRIAPKPAFSIGKHGSTREISTLMATSAAVDVLRRKNPGDTIYINNTTKQVIYMNYGTAKIPAQYFIEESISYAKSIVKSNKYKVNIKTEGVKND